MSAPFSRLHACSKHVQIVIAAVIYRAFEHVKTAQNDLIEALQKGQLSMAGVRSMNNFPVELSFKGEKYAFMVSRTSEDTLCLNINGEDIYAKVRQQPGMCSTSLARRQWDVAGGRRGTGC